jgi:hypothetical protein
MTFSIRLSLFGAVATALLAWFATPAFAGPIRSVSLDHTMFGDLNQNDVPSCKDDEDTSFSCGPTAAVNSFVWLQNRYPHIYDSKLVPDLDPNPANDLDGDGDVDFYDAMIAVAEELSTSDYMNCTACQGGTSIDNFIEGKMAWIEDHAPGVTEYGVENFHDEGDWPSWEFLYNELVGEEDIELLIGFYDEQNNRIGGHYVTLTSFHWHDADMDDIIDPGEGVDGIDDEAQINFIDPGTGDHHFADILQGDLDGPIGIFGYFDVHLAVIETAVKESPIPAPASFFLFCGGLLWLARRRAHR